MRNAKTAALSRNNHNNYTLEDAGIAIDMHGKCKEFNSGEKHCQHAVSGRCQRLGLGNIMRSAICMNYYQEYYCEYQ